MSHTYEFSGRTAVVTGAAKGIGRAIASRLGRAGARVLARNRLPVDLAGIEALAVDLTVHKQIESAVVTTAARFPTLDILVNCAGYLGPLAPLERLSHDQQAQVIAVNFVGTIEVCRHLLPLLRRSAHGRIVNLGSLAGKEGLRWLPVYSAASGGVIAFTKALAKELTETSIRVNCIAPGPIETDMILDLGPETVDAMIAASPLKRLGRAEEVAGLALWLCSDAAAFNHGAVFDMSGGRASY
jgi:3-oxoacyl-[acyl-carrier protein] reductase